jgi:DNA-binding CsgD family transcriptional regulator
MMHFNYTLLSPVKEEDLRLTFGASRIVSVSEDPIALFEPTITHFKKLAIGNYFWFIADPVQWVVHAAGGMLEQMTAIKERELVGSSPELIFKHTHPEDLTHMFAFSTYWVNYFTNLSMERKPHVHATVYLRFKNAAGIYRWVMVQYADTLLDTDGRINYGLTLLTDISHIKKDGMAMMSILDTSDDSCQQFLCLDGGNLSKSNEDLPKISPRELEVLRYLAAGYSSKQIAGEFNIAIKTIDNHRQNLLHKTNTKSTGELVAYGINNGFI